MAIFDKLKFWKKKKEDFGLGELPPLPGGAGDEFGLPGNEDFGAFPGQRSYPREQQYAQPEIRPPQLTPVTPQQYQSYGVQPVPVQQNANRDLELVSAKLDSIRATLDSINQRLANLERVAYQEQEKPRVMRQW